MYPDKIRIAISLTKDGQWEGFASKYLNDMFKADEKEQFYCNIFVKDSQFTRPEDKNTPLIMVGPGTGIAPFIGFLEDKIHLNTETKGESHLYFGCRMPDSDYIFKTCLENSEKQGHLSKLHLAFSRAENNSYVQDLFAQNKDQLLSLINEKTANIYVCGNTKMGQAIYALLKEWLG